eukprot:780785_1
MVQIRRLAPVFLLVLAHLLISDGQYYSSYPALIDSLPDSAFSASSTLSINNGNKKECFVDDARFSSNSAWCPNTTDSNSEYLSIDLGICNIIHAVATKGRENGVVDEFVASYRLEYSLDDIVFSSFNSGNPIAGNTDISTENAAITNTSFMARYMRFIPLTWTGYPSMRVEIYGHRCNSAPLIDVLPRSSFSATSSYINEAECNVTSLRFSAYAPPLGRTAWCAASATVGEYVTVDLRQCYIITDILTRGRNGDATPSQQRVTSYNMEFSMDGTTFTPHYGNPLTGNTIGGTTAFGLTAAMENSFSAQFLRFRPLAWVDWPSMRAEAIGYSCGPYGSCALLTELTPSSTSNLWTSNVFVNNDLISGHTVTLSDNMGGNYTYSQFMIIHSLPGSSAYAEWSLMGEYSAFSARIGLSAEALNSGGEVQFDISLDGALVHRSQPFYGITTNWTSEFIRLNISGVDTLRITVYTIDNDNNYDHAVVAEPQLFCDTMHPTVIPSTNPTIDPTIDPTIEPIMDPTMEPTFDPTIDPTTYPTRDPTIDPTTDPTFDPTIDPTSDPTFDPTIDPTIDPTFDPTTDPTSAPSLAPSSAPSWSPTANVMMFDFDVNNKSLGCGDIYNSNTTKDDAFDYYKLDIPQFGQYPKIIATTCCKSEPDAKTMVIDGDEYVVNINTTYFCKERSLDTVLYLLKYDTKKSEISILYENDDADASFCGENGVNSYGKSMVDLTALYESNTMEINKDMDYYLAVGGFTKSLDANGYIQRTGKYQMELICQNYVFPLDSKQFLLNVKDDNTEDIECGQQLNNHSNTNDQLVSYFYFDVTESTQLPIIVTTCDYYKKHGEYATYLYIANIQYYRYEASGFDIIKQATFDGAKCKDEESKGIDISSLEVGKYVVAVGGFNELNDDYGDMAVGVFSISVSCGTDPEAFDVVGLAVMTSLVSLSVISFCVAFCCWYCRILNKYKEEHPEQTQEEEEETEMATIAAIGLSTQDTTTHDIEDDIDTILAVMNDILDCCDDEEGLDVYQVLAVRKMHNKSLEWTPFKPFKFMGINYTLVQLSKYHQALMASIVVACLQAIGMTIILYSVTFAYFTDPDTSAACQWDGDAWSNSWPFKILAFFWALVITMSITTTLDQVKGSGFNQIVEDVAPQQYELLDVCDVGYVYFGYLVNLYTLFLAILGSYFLIYSSEEGAGAIDMVLNAVALFFMIELDDLLVTNDDYAMVREATDAFIKEYMTKMEAMQDDANKTHQKQRFGVIGLTRLSKVGSIHHFYLFFILCIKGKKETFGLFCAVIMTMCDL